MDAMEDKIQKEIEQGKAEIAQEQFAQYVGNMTCAYYRTLCAGGIPASLAENLTAMFAEMHLAHMLNLPRKDEDE